MGAAKRFYGDRRQMPAVFLPLATEPASAPPAEVPAGLREPLRHPGWYRCPDGVSYTSLPAKARAAPTTDAMPPRGKSVQLVLF